MNTTNTKLKYITVSRNESMLPIDQCKVTHLLNRKETGGINVLRFKLKRINTSLLAGIENIFSSLNKWRQKASNQFGHLGMTHHLPHLIQIRRNIADFIKESVAVVTNPAIDRDREVEHFSTRTCTRRASGFIEITLNKNHL